MTTKRTWILIADGQRARILQSQGGTDVLPVSVEARPFSAQAVPAGRVAQPVAVADVAGEPRARSLADVVDRPRSPRRGLETMFAHQIADFLETSFSGHLFDRLVLVAPVGMLADLKRAIGAPVQPSIAGEFAKDLTKVPNSEILSHIDIFQRS